ncbi:MAG: hypothetical protein ACRBI6_12315 [Acidimicrobiales bacterium]
MGDFLIEYLAVERPGLFALVLIGAAGGFVYLATLPENAGHETLAGVLIAALLIGAGVFGTVSIRRRRREH